MVSLESQGEGAWRLYVRWYFISLKLIHIDLKICQKTRKLRTIVTYLHEYQRIDVVTQPFHPNALLRGNRHKWNIYQLSERNTLRKDGRDARSVVAPPLSFGDHRGRVQVAFSLCNPH